MELASHSVARRRRLSSGRLEHRRSLLHEPRLGWRRTLHGGMVVVSFFCFVCFVPAGRKSTYTSRLAAGRSDSTPPPASKLARALPDIAPRRLRREVVSPKDTRPLPVSHLTFSSGLLYPVAPSQSFVTSFPAVGLVDCRCTLTSVGFEFILLCLFQLARSIRGGLVSLWVGVWQVFTLVSLLNLKLIAFAATHRSSRFFF